MNRSGFRSSPRRSLVFPLLLVLLLLAPLAPQRLVLAADERATTAASFIDSAIAPDHASVRVDTGVQQTDRTSRQSAGSYSSPLGFSITWDDDWQVAYSAPGAGLESFGLRGDQVVVDLLGLMAYGGEPDRCLDLMIAQYRDLPDTVRVARHFPGMDAPLTRSRTIAFGLYDVTVIDAGERVRLRAYLSCQTLVPGESVLGIGVFAPTAAFDHALLSAESLLDNLDLPRRVRRDAAAFDDLTQSIARDIDRFWRPVVRQAGGRYTPPDLASFANSIETGCFSPTSVSGRPAPEDFIQEPGTGPFHCRADMTVYLDHPWLETYVLTELGEIAVAVAIAHEIGHHMQYETGVIRQWDPTNVNDMFASEQQADCLSGAYIASAVSRGVYSERDLRAIEPLMDLIGDPRPGLGHGTASQRLSAFTTGYDFGVSGCDLGL